MPDYINAYKISLPFIVPQNGFIWAGYTYLGWGSYGQTPYILINDNKFYGGYESTHANGSAIFFPVQEGDQINIIDATSYFFYFIPSM